MRERISTAQREELDRDGVTWLHSDFFNNDYPVTQHFLDEAKSHFLLHDSIPLDIPVHLLQGEQDEDVPWETALAISQRLISRKSPSPSSRTATTA
ncbi:MAG: hypothetical protein WDN72_05975 [Alphaproteobacteria bacterium]